MRWINHHGLAICVIFRCASRSMVSAFKDIGVGQSRAPLGRTLVVCRHPLDRLASMYAKTRRSERIHWLPFTERARRSMRDAHYLPQSAHFADDPDILVPIERLADTWRALRDQYDLPALPHINSSVRPPWEAMYTDGQRRIFEAIYAADLVLHEKAMGKQA